MTANNFQNNQASQGKPSTPEATADKTVDLHDHCGNNAQNQQASQDNPSTPAATAEKTVNLNDFCDYYAYCSEEDTPEKPHYVPEQEFNRVKEKIRSLNDYSDDDEDETALKHDTAAAFILAENAQKQAFSSATQNKPDPLSAPASSSELANHPAEDTAEEAKLVSAPEKTGAQAFWVQPISFQDLPVPQEDKRSLTKHRAENNSRVTRSRGQTIVNAQSGSTVNVVVNPTIIIHKDKEPE